MCVYLVKMIWNTSNAIHNVPLIWISSGSDDSPTMKLKNPFEFIFRFTHSIITGRPVRKRKSAIEIYFEGHVRIIYRSKLRAIREGISILRSPNTLLIRMSINEDSLIQIYELLVCETRRYYYRLQRVIQIQFCIEIERWNCRNFAR